MIAVVLAVLWLEAALVPLPVYFWSIATVVSLAVGATSIHYAELSRQGERLRLAHGEIARLAQVAERERIARDLHDLLGHTLSVIVLKSELAAKLTTRDAEAAAREIRDVERISRDALREVRQAVSGYRARVASEVDRAREALRAAGVAFEPEVDAAPLPATAESVLALAIREAVTNVVRHAAARHCRLRLRLSGSAASLVVEDDGRGGSAAEGVGLASMRERLQALGGTLERTGTSGTRLAITLPVASAS